MSVIKNNRKNIEYYNKIYIVHYKTDPQKVKVEYTHYSSQYANVASVDQNGLVTTITPGKTRITLTAGDNHHTYKKKYLTIHVIE